MKRISDLKSGCMNENGVEERSTLHFELLKIDTVALFCRPVNSDIWGGTRMGVSWRITPCLLLIWTTFKRFCVLHASSMQNTLGLRNGENGGKWDLFWSYLWGDGMLLPHKPITRKPNQVVEA